MPEIHWLKPSRRRQDERVVPLNLRVTPAFRRALQRFTREVEDPAVSQAVVLVTLATQRNGESAAHRQRLRELVEEELQRGPQDPRT